MKTLKVYFNTKCFLPWGLCLHRQIIFMHPTFLVNLSFSASALLWLQNEKKKMFF